MYGRLNIIMYIHVRVWMCGYVRGTIQTTREDDEKNKAARQRHGT